MPAMEQEIATFKRISLSDNEQRSLANAAIDLRFDTKKHLVDPDELLTIHRQKILTVLFGLHLIVFRKPSLEVVLKART